MFILDTALQQRILSPQNKAHTVLSSTGKHSTAIVEIREKPCLHTSGYSVMSQRKFGNDPFGLKNNKGIIPKSNLCFLMPSNITTSIVSPNTKRPFSAMEAKIRHLSVEETRERHWGKKPI